MEKIDIISSIVLAAFLGGLIIPLVSILRKSIRENKHLAEDDREKKSESRQKNQLVHH